MTEPNIIVLLAALGQVAFIGIYVLLFAGILLIPKSLLDQKTSSVAWWKNVRVWALTICGVQILVYWLLG